MKWWISNFTGTVRLSLFQYRVFQAKPYHWSTYNIITTMAQTFWQTFETLVRAGDVKAFTCVTHAYKFFQSAHALHIACSHWVMGNICINTRIQRHLLLSPSAQTRLVLWSLLLSGHTGLCGDGVLQNCCFCCISHFNSAETQIKLLGKLLFSSVCSNLKTYDSINNVQTRLQTLFCLCCTVRQ